MYLWWFFDYDPSLSPLELNWANNSKTALQIKDMKQEVMLYRYRYLSLMMIECMHKRNKRGGIYLFDLA
jgi:hypothetical protein